MDARVPPLWKCDSVIFLRPLVLRPQSASSNFVAQRMCVCKRQDERARPFFRGQLAVQDRIQDGWIGDSDGKETSRKLALLSHKFSHVSI